VTLTADQYRDWFRKTKLPCVLVELDYMYQVGIGSSAVPTVGTLYVSSHPYVDEQHDPPLAYDPALIRAPTLERSLSRETLRGAAAVNIAGDFVLNNTDGRLNYVLALALDGSPARIAIGDPTWARSDFIDLFTVYMAKASAGNDQNQIEIGARDIGLLLNKRIGGTVQIGGTGPNADKFAPLPFGYVHNMAPLLEAEAPVFRYRYADRATNASVPVVRADGVVLTGGGVDYTDFGGYFELTSDPQNAQITCDTFLFPPDSDSDATSYRISDAIKFFVGGEAGLSALGLMGPPHGTYFDSGIEHGSVNDYYCQTLITEPKNVIEWLDEACNTINGFWSQYRDGKFYVATMRPEAIAVIIDLTDGAYTVSAEIGVGDVVRKSLKLTHRLPQYAAYQCMGNINQTKQVNFAGTLTQAERQYLEREGMIGTHFAGEEITTQYLGSGEWEFQGGAPELYHKSLSESQLIRTLISAPADDSVMDPIEDITNTMSTQLARFVAVRRSVFLPWTEFLDFELTTMEHYTLELGDAVNFIYPKFDLDGGELHQVCRVLLDPMRARMALGICRRRYAGVSGPLDRYLAQETLDLILQEDGAYIIVETYGTGDVTLTTDDMFGTLPLPLETDSGELLETDG